MDVDTRMKDCFIADKEKTLKAPLSNSLETKVTMDLMSRHFYPIFDLRKTQSFDKYLCERCPSDEISK